MSILFISSQSDMFDHMFFFFTKIGHTLGKVNNWCTKVIISFIDLAFSIADLFSKIWKIFL